MGLVIEGAVQQAPHCGRHWKGAGVESMADRFWQTASIHRTRRQPAMHFDVHKSARAGRAAQSA